MIPWKQNPKAWNPEAKIAIGSAQLSVSEYPGNQRWQWVMFSLGEYSEAPFDECLEAWPKRAVALARQAISELDLRLKEMDE